MIEADAFIEPARAAGYDFYTGVPCSFLTPMINRVIGHPKLSYVGATSEGEAVAIASGAWLAGRETVVICQNSGLGNAVNPLTSLNHPFRIPTLMIVTQRGQPGLKDEPQHELMGRVMGDLLDAIEVPHALFPTDEADIGPALSAARQAMAESELPYVFVMQKGAVADQPLDEPAPPPRPLGAVTDRLDGRARPTRHAALAAVLATVPDEAALIATTGKCGRELFTLADRDQHLYQVGSMGGASAMGLGVALNVDRPVVVLDGDGAALMKMGNLATIGTHAPKNLIHVVLDNGVHDSTGGQRTVSANVDLARVAAACGYPHGWAIDSLAGLKEALAQSLAEPGPHLLHLRLAPGSLDMLGRPTVGPREVARRFKAFLRS